MKLRSTLSLTIIGVLGFAMHAFPVKAQQHRPATSAAIYGKLQRLNSLVSVLYVAAHPDDENTRLLSWLVNGKYVRTSYLSLTRGDGGQNILGSEQGPALGLIRTHELLEARKMDGAEQYFAKVIDFGFSKNPEETFKHWDGQQLVKDVVWMYRKLRPDVVICRFPKDSMAGHGQHSASAIVAEKAYELSGNASSFPDQLSYTTPWKPKRLLLNAFRFGNRSTIKPGQFKLDVGQYDPLIGMGYGELAGISRSLHRSQGAGTPNVPGVLAEYFALLGGDTLTNSLFDGIDTTWNRVGKPEIGKDVAKLIAEFSMLHPEKSLPALLSVRKMIAQIKDEYWRTQKLEEIDAVIFDCCGLLVESTTIQAVALAGDKVATTSRVTARAGSTISLRSITWADGKIDNGSPLEHDSLHIYEHELLIPSTTPVTQPYWLSHENNGSTFQVSAQELLGLPTTPPSLNTRFEFDVMGTLLNLSVPVSFKKLDPTHGDVIEQLRIIPAVSVEPENQLAIVEATGGAAFVRIRAYTPVKDATIRLRKGEATLAMVEHISIRANTDTLIKMIVPGDKSQQDFTATFTLTVDGITYDRAIKTIVYDHIPTLQYTKPAHVRVVFKSWTTKVDKVAFINGAGDYMPTFLRLAGIEVDEIDDADIVNPSGLAKYDAVVTGVRAINTKKSMLYLMPALLRYVENGGTLLMQYNTTQDMSTKDLGPYPFKLTSKRVTEEDAQVEWLMPDHRLLTYPNKIDDEDAQGWVQERGLYFAEDVDSHYTMPLSMHDTKEPAHSGSLLYAQYGKGHYIYCSLSLFRQLPAGVNGSIQMLMNMLSIGH